MNNNHKVFFAVACLSPPLLSLATGFVLLSGGCQPAKKADPVIVVDESPEIGLGAYGYVDLMVKHRPSLRDLVVQALDDDKITDKEYAAIVKRAADLDLEEARQRVRDEAEKLKAKLQNMDDYKEPE